MRFGSCRLLAVPHLNGFSPFNLLLELQDAVQQSLGRWGAARDVDVHWHDAIAPSYYGIGVVVVATAIGTTVVCACGVKAARVRGM